VKQLLATTHTTKARIRTAEQGINGFVLNPPSTFLAISIIPAQACMVNSLAFVTNTAKQRLLLYKSTA
jgi:hypothetical protein